VTVYLRLFDYAGVFPPAQLPLHEAVAHYRRLRSGDDGWLIGPMLVRASQIDPGVEPQEVGVIADAALPPGRYAQVEKQCRPGEVEDAVEQLGQSSPVVYLESATDEAGSLITEIAAVRRGGSDVRAKLRTGGLEAASCPPPEAVADFVRQCVAAELPFKATAGLHHPFPTRSDVDGATEHGFVNLLAATRAALAGVDDLVGCLTDTDPNDFDLPTATWRGIGVDLSPGAVRASLCSIGSCDIDEPAGYLRDLGVRTVAHS
jgi:hypothetical protein